MYQFSFLGLLIYDLFRDAMSSSDKAYRPTGLRKLMVYCLMNNELEGIWEEPLVA
jgi:hypothetical protein